MYEHSCIPPPVLFIRTFISEINSTLLLFVRRGIFLPADFRLIVSPRVSPDKRNVREKRGIGASGKRAGVSV